MASSPSFGEVLEAADSLPCEDQAELVAILTRRLALSGRERIAADAREASEEFEAGMCHPTTPEDLLRDLIA